MSAKNSQAKVKDIPGNVLAELGKTDLQNERKKAKFSVEEMMVFINGSEQLKRKKDFAYQIIERDPILMFDGQPFDLSRPEMREKTMAQIRRAVEVRKAMKDPELVDQFMLALCENSESFNMRVFVSDLLFKRAFKLFGTKEQYEAWVDDIEQWRVIGCFAMTELGHSSSLRGIETTATYDRQHDEFVIHSPSMMATKWWIGMAGQTATHTVALCQLEIDGRNHGLHWFCVPLRSRETGKLLPGVTAGDIGSKAGRQGLDNGWIQFSQVRVPRTNMLMKWAIVEKNGKFTSKTDNPAISYAGLIPERLEITRGIPSCVGQALTIATRYACIRRQGLKNEQIMDYTTQYTFLAPAISFIYAVISADKFVWDQWRRLEVSAEQNPQEFLKLLPDMHSLSAGIKSMITWWGADALEGVRRCMGGHAFSIYNSVASIISDYGVMTTGGGDNYVLTQQTARYLLSSLKDAMRGKRIPEDTSVAYLNRFNDEFFQTSACPFSTEMDFMDLEKLRDMFTWVVIRNIQTVGVALSESMSASSPTKAWNTHLPDLINLANLHTHMYLMDCFLRTIRKLRSSSSNLVDIQTLLAQTHFLSTIKQNLVHFLKLGYFNPAQVQQLESVLNKLCYQVRDQAVALVDCWGFPDWVIKSPLGCYDGDGYRKYMEIVKSAPNCFGVPSYFEKEIKPLTWANGGKSSKL